MADNDTLLIRQSEACRRLGICRKTLLDEIEQGRLIYIEVGKGKRKKFRPSDLETYIERQKRGCDASGALSPDAKGGMGGTKTSPFEVIDFETALAMTRGKLNAKPPNATPKLNLVISRRPKHRRTKPLPP